ncbi:MAG: helix-turn-helix domain-containing protein [Candidatus Pacearchaeota archaeon]
MSYEEIKAALERFGLSSNEAKVYLTLLKLGSAMAGKIAKEAMLDRTSCYDSLKRLLKKGLISYALEANRKLFKSEDPKKLLLFLKEKQEDIEKIMPELLSIYKKEKEKYNVTLYKGYKGIKSVFEDILKEAKGKENLVIDSSGVFVEKMPYYAPHFIKGLEKNKIRVRHIVRKGKNIHPSKTTEVRFFSKKLKETTVTTNIYNDKIAIILWTDVPEAIIIENKGAADCYRDYFEILWEHAEKT